VLATQASKPPARLKFEEKAGLVPVEILQEVAGVVGAELTAPQPLRKRTPFSAEQAAAGISLTAADIRTDRHPPQIVSVGLPFLVVELTSRDALRRARPDASAFARTFPCDGSDSYGCGATRFSIFTPSRSSMISAIHCRWQCK
jgi:trans-2,3-dihydro-3-hydroxyanthranilate isomerase